MTILQRIVARRRQRIEGQGYAQGLEIPPERQVPIVPFGQKPFLICEVKRKSPSAGSIAVDVDPVARAGLYVQQGVRNISVLTEEEHFAGSLQDLMRIKAAFPRVAVLRKDFLLEPEDVDISYRAGADAVLLIASILSKQKLAALYRQAGKLGMAVLFEVHSAEDADKARSIKPAITGVNARDLMTFNIDLTFPLQLKKAIDWTTRLVFESGIHRRENGALALSAGYSGLLVGQAVMQNTNLIGELLSLFGRRFNDFWARLYARKAKKPLIKICGITRQEDAQAVCRLGADVMGFIFAPSPRRADYDLPPKLKDLDILKVGVVVLDQKNHEIDARLRELLEGSFIDALQFHGDEKPDECFNQAFPYYKVIQIADKADIVRINSYHCPRVLIDAFSREKRGGTGKSINNELVKLAARQKPLWLAGGIGVHNVRNIIEKHNPELIDASTRLEASAGCKDIQKLAEYFKEIEHAEVL